eukprot:TRINITY_DN4927_c0_g2_i1.p1 TRINITY_DN4927_c0_g2~~TRINITY_DN4927_c0_g2_i1.p1  ORF type:complete len:639 (+),score=194.31 TRINITY_DN4927_c0_g2_i1:62-1978(+)
MVVWAALALISAQAAALSVESRVTTRTLAGVTEDGEEALWLEWQAKYGRRYAPAERESRRRAWRSSLRTVARLNSEHPRTTYALTQFADLTEPEFRRAHAGCSARPAAARRPGTVSRRQRTQSRDGVPITAPVSVDWRKEGAVTSPKNQGRCGDCWTFAITGAVEGAWAAAGRGLPSLSEELFSNCCDAPGCGGCQGGDAGSGLEWLLEEREGTAVTEASFPVQSTDGKQPGCPANWTRGTGLVDGAQINAVRYFSQSESEIRQYVALHGPVAVSLDAGPLQWYSAGVITDCKYYDTDHAVTIVGYAADYWIIKNSYSVSWGEAGFFRIQMDRNCLNVAEHAVAAVVDGGQPRDAVDVEFHGASNCSKHSDRASILLDTCTPLFVGDRACERAGGLGCYRNSMRTSVVNGTMRIAVFADDECSEAMGGVSSPVGDCTETDLNGNGTMAKLLGPASAIRASLRRVSNGLPVPDSRKGATLTPAPPPPPEGPATGWHLLNCTDAGCTACAGRNVTLPFDVCIPALGLYVTVAGCSPLSGLQVTFYDDANCSTRHMQQRQTSARDPLAVDTCYTYGQTGHVMFLCAALPATSAVRAPAAAAWSFWPPAVAGLAAGVLLALTTRHGGLPWHARQQGGDYGTL